MEDMNTVSPAIPREIRKDFKKRKTMQDALSETSDEQYSQLDQIRVTPGK